MGSHISPICLHAKPCAFSISASPALQTYSNSSFWISFFLHEKAFSEGIVPRQSPHWPFPVDIGAAWLAEPIGHQLRPLCTWAAKHGWAESEMQLQDESLFREWTLHSWSIKSRCDPPSESGRTPGAMQTHRKTNWFPVFCDPKM